MSKPKTTLLSLDSAGLRISHHESIMVTGLDPGSKATAYARLSIVLDAGHIAIAYHSSGEILNDGLAKFVAAESSAILAIEKPEGRVYSSKGAGIVPHLLQAANAAGIARGAAEVANIVIMGEKVSILECPAVRWRTDVCGKPNASNAVVKEAVLRLVGGWPKRSDNHERDAAGVAIHAARVLGILILSKMEAA